MKDDLIVEGFVLGPLETNCYLAYGSNSLEGVLIDPGAPDAALVRHIKNNGINLRYVINTHGHADHIMGNASFGLPVLIHALDEACLEDPVKNLSAGFGARMTQACEKRLLKGGETLDVGGLQFRIIHTPGHTPGGISVLCGDVLFSGDVLFCESVGRTDLPGGDYKELIKSIKEKLMALPDGVKVLPGHGPRTTIGHERKRNPYL